MNQAALAVWDNKSSYEHMRKHTNLDWAWEFIKRDERYIKEWNEQLENIKTSISPLLGMLTAPNMSSLSNNLALPKHAKTILVAPDDSPLSANVVLPKHKTNNPKDENLVVLSHKASEWRMRYFQNPTSPKLFNGNHCLIQYFYRGDTRGLNLEDFMHELNVPLEDNSLVIKIDLTRAVKPQIEETSEIIKSLKVRSKRKAKTLNDYEVDTRIEYLQMLDALNKGIKPKNAYKKIFPNKGETPELAWKEARKQIKNHYDTKYIAMIW